MSKLGIFISVLGAFLLVILVLGVIGYMTPVRGVPLISMEESGTAMQQAGLTMQNQGQAIVEEGRRQGSQSLVTHGEHWLKDGQELVKRGQLMAADPTATSSLQSTQRDLAAQGNWNTLVNASKAMAHNPAQVGSINLEALRWDGQGMVSEGQNMAEHGQVMAGEVDVMVKLGQLAGPAAQDLRQAAQVMREVGFHLAETGQEMIDYADRF